MTVCQKHRFDNPEVPDRERERTSGAVAGKLPGKFGEILASRGTFQKPGGLTPSQRLARYVSKVRDQPHPKSKRFVLGKPQTWEIASKIFPTPIKIKLALPPQKNLNTPPKKEFFSRGGFTVGVYFLLAVGVFLHTVELFCLHSIKGLIRGTFPL